MNLKIVIDSPKRRPVERLYEVKPYSHPGHQIRVKAATNGIFLARSSVRLYDIMYTNKGRKNENIMR